MILSCDIPRSEVPIIRSYLPSLLSSSNGQFSIIVRIESAFLT
jgi:hypothetical protein